MKLDKTEKSLDERCHSEMTNENENQFKNEIQILYKDYYKCSHFIEMMS